MDQRQLFRTQEFEGRPAKRMKTDHAAASRNVTINDLPYRQPCSTAFEEENGVELNFNYWIQNHHPMYSEDVIQFIVDLLHGNKSEILKSKLVDTDIVPVIIVAIHGMDPFTLASINAKPDSSYRNSFNFLNHCSSVPIRHNVSKPQGNSGMIQWRYNDVENMNSLILWPTVPRIPSGISRFHYFSFKLY